MELFAESLTELDKTLPGDVQRFYVNRGYRGTKDTIQKMREAVQWGKRWPGTRRHVADLISSCSRKDYMCMVRAVFDETQGYHYVFDPSGVELIQGIDETYRIRMGDCDDFSVKMCTELESIGIPCYLKCIKAKPGSDEFTHVYAVAVVPGVGKVPLDATMPYPAGWEAADGKLPCKLWPSSFDEMETHGGGENSSMSGLATYPPELTQYGISGCETTPETAWGDALNEGNSFAGLDALPIVAEDGDISGDNLSGLDCAECGGTCGDPVTESGLSGLGDTSNELSLSSVLDGSAYSELRAAKDESNQRAIDAGSLLTQARSSGDAQAIAAANQAVAAVAQERNALFRAINAYSQLANGVQTYSLGVYKPQQLSGLGIAPAILYTLLGIAAIVALTTAFSVAMSAWRGDAQNSKNVIQQATDLVAATGHAAADTGSGISSALKTAAVVGVVGLLAFVGYKVLRKRGTV